MTNATTITSEERIGMIQCYSDFHKEAYGIRSRIDVNALSDAELISDFAEFQRVCTEDEKREAEHEHNALMNFDRSVEKFIACGAKNREEAIRWMTKEEDFRSSQCVESWVWNLGFYYTPEGKELIQFLIKQEGMIKRNNN